MIKDDISFTQIQNSLRYLHVEELRDICNGFSLCIKGKKMILINRIIHFLKTGEKTTLSPYPRVSMGQKSQENVLSKDSLMLKGLYKNDLKTRIFFKSLIGSHFHFTAFGIDWLEECWMNGTPPTYQEFANMWTQEWEFRKKHGSTPKEEWAYINFVKEHLDRNPGANRDKILELWQTERLRHKEIINRILKKGI